MSSQQSSLITLVGVTLAVVTNGFQMPLPLEAPSSLHSGAAWGGMIQRAGTSPLLARPSTSLSMVVDEEAIKRVSRAARKAGPNDRVVEIQKPLGLVLEEDEKGNVYVAQVQRGGNAAKTKMVEVGDKIAFISATFGDDVWSARGVGLARVQSSVKIRSGNFVTLVLESKNESKQKATRAALSSAKAQQQREEEQARRDRLLQELDADSKKKSKKFFGLF